MKHNENWRQTVDLQPGVDMHVSRMSEPLLMWCKLLPLHRLWYHEAWCG